jgi:hypothetical protein
MNVMPMDTDLSFITNEEDQSLKERFEVLIKDTTFFDCLVGYFYSSGFHAIYPSLENTERIRILIGVGTSKNSFRMMEEANKPSQQPLFAFSHAEAKEKVGGLVEKEMAESEDKGSVEEGVRKFIEWIRSGKLEIKAYPSKNIHAKLYIMTFKEGDRDTGRVITGSSNFTRAGLIDNLEFNVELKNRSDYEFAKQKFEDIWDVAVDVSEKYVQTIRTKTWLNDKVTPYQLYLKFLYEYFQEELSRSDELLFDYDHPEIKQFEYQEQAVLNAKKILMEYGGVFIADVVGLGKTYVTAMLARQLPGRTLVIAPPALLEKANPGSWPNVFYDFQVPAQYESLGKLDAVLANGTDRYDNVVIDEAHRFRNQDTQTYEKLAAICRGKKVMLVTATPYNNTPNDILSLLKLFQNAKKSIIPNLPDLESFFKGLEKRLKGLDRKQDREKYMQTVKANAREIRDKVLKYLMVRRTRRDIENYFKDDIQKRGLKFPEVKKPEALFYEFNDEEERVFNETIKLLTSRFRYARYMPMLYYRGKIGQLEKQSQRNLGRFMKILLVKRRMIMWNICLPISLNLNEKELESIKPEFTTEELERYYTDKKNKRWVIYTHSKFKHPESMDEYPHLKAHLDQFADVITSDNKPYGLHRARDERFFVGKKVMSVRKCKMPRFTYTDFDCYVSAAFYIIKTDRINLKYLTALLNSDLMAFWLRNKGKMQGNNYQVDKGPLLELPIYNPPEGNSQTLIDLMDQIIEAKKNNVPSEKLDSIETEINQAVFDLYNLTPEEIKIVEGND